jgi:hypothetical protein
MTQLACLFKPGSLLAEKLTVIKVKASQGLLAPSCAENLVKNVEIW